MRSRSGFELPSEPAAYGDRVLCSSWKLLGATIGYLFWSHKVHTWLQGQSVGLGIEDELDVGTVIGNAKTHYAQTWHQNSLSSVARYQPLQPEYVLAPYLSAVKGFKS